MFYVYMVLIGRIFVFECLFLLFMFYYLGLFWSFFTGDMERETLGTKKVGEGIKGTGIWESF